MTLTDTHIDTLVAIAWEAGQRILEIYHQVDPVAAQVKSDNSPLTQADLAAHHSIVASLTERFPEIPIISEESAETVPLEERQEWKRFWLVDPLDGTKEFIKRTGYFTVNIGLIEDGRPIFGIVHAPVQGCFYGGGKGMGAFRQESLDAERTSIVVAGPVEGCPLRVVASRDHAGPEVAKLLAANPEAETLSIGSSLKFCLIAEGTADVYLRDVPTMEWDTAAAHAVVEGAGGTLVTWPDREPLAYNKSELQNPSLITLGKKELLPTLLTASS